MDKLLGWLGAAFGITGAVLLSENIPISGWGFVFFITSSVCLSIWAFRKKEYHQLTMQVVFTVINFNGCIKWLV